MSETAELKKRLEALEGKTQNRKARPSVVTIALGIGAIAALGGLLLLFSGGSAPESLETASPDEFQEAGPGFGALDPTPLPIDTSPPPEPEPDSETEELRAQMDAMRSELEALRNARAPEATTVDLEALDTLGTEIDALRSEAAATQAALREELEERARQIQRLQNDLELARLETPRTPAPTGPTAEELRLQELERRRQAELEELQARIASPIIAFGGTGGGNSEPAAQQRQLDGDTDFVRNGAEPADVTQAQLIVNPSNTVVQGTMVQAVLETAIDSSLAGQVRAMVSEDVHAYDGSRILIPRGARLIGRYQSGLDIAQQRVTIAWDRIILPSNQTVEISAFGGDELGRSGTTGFVDSRFGTRFGSAALISLIGALPAVAAQNTEDEITSDVLEGIGEDLQDSAQSVIGEYLSVSPVIYVDQGARVTVMVDRDLEIF
ncbi:TrbI/VirB10 family protein [Phaeobacter gallaeciensis]|uniref:Type IV secretion system protein VirB10 n=1 Tax=Phaeobacter gallaeciensis TaxID=60890 RepID=A0AAC9Z7S4_9RHOB|nr:TrbI/VirB10 family protein [Phaeobacter gallaeciensis]AHD08875.1 Type IV secretory pathway, VirB10 component [Phaeobacter gallaeciensis DSM 26640]ATE92141.1 putative type IV secretion system protein VirB10 [Phaeobacter gallaeciensis]ATE98040.1 putative type IV secretion system protein VirB10 [Phaeobacter gallaeciensis]ATF00803.1 putative type IV secretion system protein VirB10 [Phaeobacter gallaeciensis]ATF05183.1 putative type IV secretion system protein VirB10 [Phaeobacter gallaeciensis]